MSTQSNEGGEQVPQEQEKPKRVRRTRKDGDERAFVCKICQKTYLSNAALYTHVKNKHEAQRLKAQKQKQKQQPDNQKQKSPQKPPKQQKVQKVEKPQKQQKAPIPVPESPQQQAQQQQQQASPALQSLKQSKQQPIDLNASSLEKLRQYMKKYYPERNKGCTIRLICQGLVSQILQYIQPILKQAIQLKNTQITKSKQSLNQIFGTFLILMNIRVSSTCINFLIRFFFYLRHAIKTQTKRPDYCETQNAANLPNYFNKIVLNQRIPAPGFDEDEMMHNPIIVCRVLEYFGEWLYEERYTDYVVRGNYGEDDGGGA